MTEKPNKRHSIGKFIDRIFRGRSNSLPASSAEVTKKTEKEKDSKKKKSKKEKSKSLISESDEFGIKETERLTHFQKPKPPPNRRRPRGVPASAPTSRSVVVPIREEDETGDDPCHFPETEPSENLNSNPVVVDDKVVQAPKLFTPSLPSVALREKMFSNKKDRTSGQGSSTKSSDEVDEMDKKSESFEIVDENDPDLRNKIDSSSEVASNENSNKSSLSLSRSLSGKIDFDQIRSKSKNLRLVKSLEVGQKGSTGTSIIRSSDPGRQWNVLTATKTKNFSFFRQMKPKWWMVKLIIQSWMALTFNTCTMVQNDMQAIFLN